ncbi:hypothetical protein TNCV_3940521 [Trichonephila clavipes]|uniref:Uncharacterized protein n=1 Tax=Trichonephila clavipes TaxID=2585209 RepID=A0A8X7B8H7_TRICX|nr:hypothetical protein TNCV_3940521 [Trichonephila clavipes]
MSHQEKKQKHINSLQSLNDVIHWSPSTLNVPSEEKTETHQFSQILERYHPLESFNSKCPIRRKTKHINSLQSLNDVIHWSPSTLNVPSGEKRKHINSLQSLNDAIHWSSSTLNVPSGEKTETHQFSPILERCHPLEFFNSKCPIRRKTETHQFSPILERCHPLESFNSKCPIRRKKQKHINSLQSLNDVIHWSPSTLNVPSGEKTETHQFSPILERCHPLESSNLNVPSGEKTETHQFSPILERCHPLESFNSKCPIRRKNGNTSILSLSLNDAIHWSSSTLNVPSGEKTKTH